MRISDGEFRRVLFRSGKGRGVVAHRSLKLSGRDDRRADAALQGPRGAKICEGGRTIGRKAEDWTDDPDRHSLRLLPSAPRSAQRRLGIDGFGTYRSRWSPHVSKIKTHSIL